MALAKTKIETLRGMLNEAKEQLVHHESLMGETPADTVSRVRAQVDFYITQVNAYQAMLSVIEDEA